MSIRFPSFLYPALFAILVCIQLLSCRSQPAASSDLEPGPRHSGLFSPVQLESGPTTLLPADYFPFGDWPEQIAGARGYQIRADPTRKTITLTPASEKRPWLSVLTMRFGSREFGIVLKRSRKRMTTISYDPGENVARSVQLAGEMNHWNPGDGEMRLVDGTWQISLELAPGDYQYQFVVDGTWTLDPRNPVKVDNNLGGWNSQLRVPGGAGWMQATETAIYPERANDGLIEVSWREHARENGGADIHFIALLDNEVISESSMALSALKGGETFKIVVPERAKLRRRSHIRVFAHTASRYLNDLLIPLEKGVVVRDPALLTGEDQHANILYFLMVDRFASGSADNDHPVLDPEVHPKANYHGGDIAGIRAKLDSGYFEDLGINVLWLSPIVRNPDSAFHEFPEPHRKFSGYHGYWPVRSREVDPRFGTPRDVKSLVDAAHRRGIKVLIDFVANHVHREHPMLQEHPDWKTPLHLEDESLNIRIWDAQRLTTWFDTFLPSLDFFNPEVVETQVDHALWWVKEFGLDGFRHDATKHIPTAFWRRLSQKLKTEHIIPEGAPLFQIGETFGSRELIGRYVGSGMLDGQFDFNQYFDVRASLCRDTVDTRKIAATLRASLTEYGHHSLMGNITGNHDIARFIAYAGKGLRFDEDAQEAGWAREIRVEDPRGYERLKMLFAYLMAVPGVPVIYYGDEIGMPGAGDPDNRRDMRFEKLSPRELDVRATSARLIALRRAHMAAMYGETDISVPDDHSSILMIRRSYFDERMLFVFNFKGETQRVTLAMGADILDRPVLHFGGALETSGSKASLDIAPMSFEVITSGNSGDRASDRSLR